MNLGNFRASSVTYSYFAHNMPQTVYMEGKIRFLEIIPLYNIILKISELNHSATQF